MPGLENTMGAIPGGGTVRKYGTAYWDGAEWRARVGPNLLSCRWLDPIQPKQGGNIVVDITKDEYGQASGLVIGGYTDQPRPSTGVVLFVGVTELVIAGEDGVTYTTDRFLGVIGDYAVSDPLYITWDASQPTVLGIVNDITITPDAAPPPEAPTAGTGSTNLIATASDTWGVGGWGRWATSQNGGEDVYTGSIGGYTVTGSWFYGSPNPELSGKTLERITFRLPQRLNVGSGGAVTVDLYAHTSPSRPGSDVTRVVGPHTVSVNPGETKGVIDLPLTFAATVAAGGGISIAGGPYAGFASRLDDAESGKATIYWRSA
jgi:hypothetical protein